MILFQILECINLWVGGVSIVYTGKVKYSNVSNLSIIIYDENG